MKISDEEDWIRCSCPLARHTHSKGTDENPSFGVAVNDKGESGFHCFTCRSGRLFDLIHILQFSIGIRVAAIDFYSMAEIFDPDAETTDWTTDGFYKDLYQEEYVPQKKIAAPPEIVEEFPLLEFCPNEEDQVLIENYFIDRGISVEMLHEYDTRMQLGSRYIIFPIIDTDREVYRLHVKILYDKTFFYITPEMMGVPEQEQWGRKDYWYGMQFYDPTRPVHLVESETDVLRLRSLGIDNILGSCGPLNKWKAERITNEVIYSGFDSDPAGSKFTLKAMQFFRGRQVYRLNWDLVQVRWYTKIQKRERIRQAKDAGDLETLDQYNHILAHKVALAETSLDMSHLQYRSAWQ